MRLTKADPADQVRNLMFDYVDGTLEPAGVAELNQLLKGNKELCREAALVLLQEVQLAELGEAERARRNLAGELTAMPLSLWARCLCFAANLKPQFNWAKALVAMGVAVILVCGVFWVFQNSPQLVEMDGAVLVTRNGNPLPPSPKVLLKAGDRIVVQSNAAATVRFRRESTLLRLSESTQVRLDPEKASKSFLLETGRLDAIVAPQSRHAPFRIVTAEAEALVLGTEFSLVAAKEKTILEVGSGKVRLTRAADNHSIEVAPGQSAIAAPETPLECAPVRAGILIEYWSNLRGSRVEDLVGAPAFPDRPDSQDHLSRIELPKKRGDFYGVRLRGWLRAPQTGSYQFWIAADDHGELWIGRNENPGSKERLCYTPAHTTAGDWEKWPEQASRSVHLIAGRRYYLEVLMQQAGGEECLSVAWQGPGITRQVIDGRYLSPATSKIPEGR